MCNIHNKSHFVLGENNKNLAVVTTTNLCVNIEAVCAGCVMIVSKYPLDFATFKLRSQFVTLCCWGKQQKLARSDNG